METHLISDDENVDLKDKFLNQKHQMLHNKGWIGASLQIYQSHLILMLLTTPTCQSSLKIKRTLSFARILSQSKLLCWLGKLNHSHVSSRKQNMAKCQIPTSTSCLYGKATRRPWRTKPKDGQHGGISIDQLESSIPGLSAQMKGWLPKKRYKVATIFVDHFSGLSYIHIQKSTNADEPLEAKNLAFERYASKFKVQVKSYQSDTNCRFVENKFIVAVKESGQTITFCGVNAHFQDAVAERRIRTL